MRTVFGDRGKQRPIRAPWKQSAARRAALAPKIPSSCDEMKNSEGLGLDGKGSGVGSAEGRPSATIYAKQDNPQKHAFLPNPAWRARTHTKSVNLFV